MKLKVLQLGRYYPPDIGGIESVIYDLTVGLNARGVHCDVLCSNKKNQTTIEEFDGYKVIRTASMGAILSTSITFTQIRLLRKLANNYDVIVIHHPDPMATLALLLSGFRNKVVVFWHSDIVRQTISFALYAPFQRWLLKCASSVISTSENYAKASKHLRAFFGKIETIQIGTEVNHLLDDSLLRALRVKYAGRKVIFSLGRLVYYKGYEFLIQASSFLDKNFVILIGGDGPLRKKLTHMAQNSNSGCDVELLGRIPQEQLASYYQLCDVFCMPSIERSEAFGVVLIEAMYYGKPIVATNIRGSGVNWVNEHGTTGLNVEPKNSKALANAIKQIFSNDLVRQQFGEASKHRYATYFTRDRMIDKFIRLIRKLTN